MGTLFGYLAELLKYVMIFCDRIVGQQYWLALFLFALVIKILLFPLGIKQQKSQQKAAKLRPKEEVIRRKYKDQTDKASQQKMNEELMAMYQKEKYNQFGGCLPLLIQMPILFSLYYIIQNPLHYICRFGQAQIEVISDTFNRITGYAANTSYQNLTIKATNFLSKPDGLAQIIENLPVDGSVPTGAVDAAGTLITSYDVFRSDLITQLNEAVFPKFGVFGFIDLSITPSEQIWWYILMPIITFVVLFLTMRLQKKFTYQPMAAQAASPSTKMMEYTMPVLSAVFTFSLPTAMGLYWIYQNVLGFVQQVIMSKLFPTPVMTEAEVKEALKEADKAAYEAKKQQEKLMQEQKKLSVHDELDGDYVPKKKDIPADDGWVEPMGPRHTENKADGGKKKKSSLFGKNDMKDDK